MKIKKTWEDIIMDTVIGVALIIFALACLYPIWFVLMASFTFLYRSHHKPLAKKVIIKTKIQIVKRKHALRRCKDILFRLMRTVRGKELSIVLKIIELKTLIEL